MSKKKNRRASNPLPGFAAGLSITSIYLAVLLIIPLGACVLKTCSLDVSQFVAAVWSPRARSAYMLTFGASVIAALFNVIFGVLLAWVLVRYKFPGRRIMDAVIDLPFALPTSVAGLIYSSLYVKNGWFGQFMVPLGFEGAYTRTSVVLVLVFLGLPFVVRTVQPLLSSLEAEMEEAAASLGANRWQSFLRVILPSLYPALLTGFALAFARGLGEYGSVVFVSGNMPFRTEIAPVLIVQKLEEYAYAEATAIATVLLAGSMLTLGLVSWLDSRSRHHAP